MPCRLCQRTDRFSVSCYTARRRDPNIRSLDVTCRAVLRLGAAPSPYRERNATAELGGWLETEGILQESPVVRVMVYGLHAVSGGEVRLDQRTVSGLS